MSWSAHSNRQLRSRNSGFGAPIRAIGELRHLPFLRYTASLPFTNSDVSRAPETMLRMVRERLFVLHPRDL